MELYALERRSCEAWRGRKIVLPTDWHGGLYSAWAFGGMWGGERLGLRAPVGSTLYDSNGSLRRSVSQHS